MKSGRIELRTIAGDRLIRWGEYDCRSRRDDLLKKWKMYYAKKFDLCYIQIIPTIDNLEIDIDGTNLSKRTDHYKSKMRLKLNVQNI